MTGALVLAWIQKNWKLLAGAALAVLIVGLWFGLQAKGRHDQEVRDRAAQAAALDKARAVAAAAQARSDFERQTDTKAVANLKANLINAYASTPDSAPSGVRLALSCQRLRGTPQARLPEFSKLCRPDGSAQAAAGH